MTNSKTKSINWKKLLQVATLSVLAAAPLNTLTAQAAPAYDSRDRDGDGDYDKADREYNRAAKDDRVNNRDLDNTGNLSTITGVVTSDPRGRDFTIRTDSGQTLTVRAQDGEPSRLDVGDRVRVYGRLTSNNIFLARAVDITRESSNVNNSRGLQTITGIVTRDRSGNNFTIRTDSGSRVRVRARDGEPSRLSDGDRVSVYGRFTNNTNTSSDNVFIAQTVDIISEGGRNGSRNLQTITGIVTKDRTGNNFTIRTDDGQTVRVRARDGEPDRLSNGDRVSVYGRYENNRNSNSRSNANNVFTAQTVDIISQGGRNRNNRNSQSLRTLTGVVTSDTRGSQFTIRTDGGQIVRVLPEDGQPSRLTVGDRVQVYGRFENNSSNSNSIFRAQSVNITQQNGRVTSNNRNDINVNFAATVIDSNSRNNTMNVRADNGRTYLVSTPEADNFDRGDRVRIRGNSERGIVYATDVDRL